MHRIDDGFQRQAEWRNFVFHFRGHLGIYGPFEKSTFLHVSQLMREHFLRHPANSPLEVGETLHPLKEIPQQHNLPPTADQVCREFGRTGEVLSDGFPFYHQGFQVVPRVPHGALLFSLVPALYRKRGVKQTTIFTQVGYKRERRDHHDTST
jgi:hypothetical protein